MYKWKKVREMYFNEKVGIKKIARELRISKNTVKKYIKNIEKEPKYHLSHQREKKLDFFKEVINESINRKLIGTAIFKKLLEAGYEGSIANVYRHLKAVEYVKVNKDVVTRFKTLPGEQMQYDWKEWDFKINDKSIKLYVHCLILGYSRKKFFTISLDKSSSSVIRAIIEGFEYFKGYCETLVIDNAKSMVLNHSTKDRAVEFSDDFLLFTGKYNIKPIACYPYRPKTKGKVEKPLSYLEEHFLKYYDFNSLEDLELKLKIFNEEYNSKDHSALLKKPNEVFELEEKSKLKPLQNIDLSKIFIKETRKVSLDGYVSYCKKYYPVPLKYSNKNVFIEDVMGVNLNIYALDLNQIKTYKMMQFEKNNKPQHPEHIIINNERKEKTKKIRSDNILKFVETFKEDGKIFIEGLEKANGINSYYHLSCLLKYIDIYGYDVVKNAINKCVSIKAFHKDSIKTFLSREIPKVNYSIDTISIMPAEFKIRCNLEQYKYLSELTSKGGI